MTIICCSIFKNEIETLKNEKLFNHDVKYITSMLHLNPAKLEVLLHKQIVKLADDSIILVYGDCCPAMLDFSHKANTTRTEARNCCELLLGRESYIRHIKDGAFFFMPEWVMKWKEIFVNYMKLNKSVAVDMIGHLHSHFVYLDTGIVPVPTKTLNAISEYFELPWRTEVVDIKANLLGSLTKAIKTQEKN